MYVVINIFATISNALSTYVSQNAGAKEFTRIKQGFKSGLIICAVLTVVTTILFLTLSDTLLKIFENEDDPKEVIEVGNLFIKTLAPFIFFMAIKIPCDGVLKGSEDMLGFVLGTMLDLAVRVICSFILVKVLGVKGIFLSWPIGWGVGAISSVICYIFGRWKKLIGATQDTQLCQN